MLHCLVLQPLPLPQSPPTISSSPTLYVGSELTEGLTQLRNANCLVGHNIIGFDLPALFKLGLWDGPVPLVIDTLIVSRLLWPERTWGHGLGAWGKHLSFEKGDFHEWEKYTDEMGAYCLQDVAVNVKVFEALTEEWSEDFLPKMEVY